jgi:hypothetical protein
MSKAMLKKIQVRKIFIVTGKQWNEQGSKGEEGIEEEWRSEVRDDNNYMITIEET